MTAVDVHATCCAVCSTEGNSTVLYSANFSPEDFSPAVFSARRLPDRIHYRLVRCNSCGLDDSSVNIYTINVSSILYFQRNTAGAALISSKY
jgi:hypothetical protein